MDRLFSLKLTVCTLFTLSMTIDYSLGPAFQSQISTLNVVCYKRNKQEGNGDKKEPAEGTQ